MPGTKIPIPVDEIAAFCRKWHIKEFAVFGSVLRDDFGPNSDIDCLVTFHPGSQRSLDDWMAMETELRSLLGRPVDLVERRLVEQSENYIRRGHILQSAQRLYAE
jgi:uncharacterized protein